MKIKYQLLSLFVVALFLFSCSSSSKKEITSTVESFYIGNSGYRTANKNLLSKEFSSLIEKAILVEENDAERIRQSEFPTDKPLMIEGDLFSSLYEGSDSFNISEIKINDNSAIVSINFSNKEYKEFWTDQVQMINENGWKIDDIIYSGHKMDVKSAKEVLKAFTQ